MTGELFEVRTKRPIPAGFAPRQWGDLLAAAWYGRAAALRGVSLNDRRMFEDLAIRVSVDPELWR